MALLIGVIGIVFLRGLLAKEYGYVFHAKDSYIQTKYPMLCDSSVVKLELFINRTKGVVFYAENREINSSLLIYFVRPGMYMNATMKGRIFDLSAMVDFFNSQWFDWHDMEIRIGEKQLSLVFDRNVREGVFDGGDMFPAHSVEQNYISFGGDNEQFRKMGFGFEGLMRNFQYKSCACDQWRPVEVVGVYKVSKDHLGQCSSDSACEKDCSCVLMPWGSKRCECPQPGCATPGNDIYYRFNSKGEEWNANQRLKIIRGSRNISYSTGIFGSSFLIHDDQWMVLSPIGTLACFTSIFFCEKEFYYQLWMKPTLTANGDHTGMGNEELVLKHASSLQSPYGFEISRIWNHFRFTFTTDSNYQFHFFSDLPILQWNRISVAFNQTTLRLFLNSELIRSTSNYVSIDYKRPKVITTKYLFVGTNKSNPNVEMENFYFSTNGSVLQHPSVQILRLEQCSMMRKTIINCDIESSADNLINLAKCYKEIFEKSNFSLGFYMSIIFNISTSELPTVLVKSSFFHLTLKSETLIEMTLMNGENLEIPLKRTLSTLRYLEISVTPDNEMTIIQNIDTVLHKGFPFDMGTFTEASKNIYMFISGNQSLLKEITIMNMDKGQGTLALRIPTSNVSHLSVDFDDQKPFNYPMYMRSEGYIGYGMELRPPGNFHIFRSFDRSCVRNLDLCYHGLTIAFRLQVKKTFDNSTTQSLVIFSSGNTGITLLLDNYNHFILIVKEDSVMKFIPKRPGSLINQWALVELSISQNRMFSLFIDGAESYSMGYFQVQLFSNCFPFCLGNETLSSISKVLKVDEINIWDMGREFLYANDYISSGMTGHKLYSFSNYQLNTDIGLAGSAELIPTKYGQGVFLNGFGPRFAEVRLLNEFSCFSTIDNCRRGIMIRLRLRMDKLTNSRQIFVSGPQLVLGADRGCLFVHLYSANRFWLFGSEEVLPIFHWQRVVVSWRKDSGMKIFIGDRFVGHVFEGFHDRAPYSTSQLMLYVGKYHSEQSSDYPTILIDDLEFYDADRNSMANDNDYGKEFSCFLRHSFDGNYSPRTYLQLGIIGNAGIFYPNITTERQIPILPCFSDSYTGCRGCFALRFWIYMNAINTDVLQIRNTNLHLSKGNLKMDIVDSFTGVLIIFVCPYDGSEFIRKWNFIEISWDFDEGLLVFVNRDLLSCKHLRKADISQQFSKDIEISINFNGAIDELELYRNRLPILYWNKVIDEKQIYFLLQKLKDKRKFEKDILLANRIGQGTLRSTMNLIQSFEFNGTNHLKYKILSNEYTIIPGSTEEIKVSFKSFDNTNNKTILMIEDKKSLKNLSIKNHKLYFTIVYFLPHPNGTTKVGEELEVYPNLKTNVVYDVFIQQLEKKIVLNITSAFVTESQNMIGREDLLPGQGIIYIGGHEKNQNTEFSQSNSSFIGVLYKAQVKSIFKRETVDIIRKIAEAMPLNPNVKVNMKPMDIISKSRTVLMEAIVDKKIPFTINDPFASIVLPQWNSEIMSSFEAEFRTFESRGLLMFIGNTSDFVAVEIFDSQLFFQYKLFNSWKRVTLEEKGYVVNDNRPHSVYLGQDINGYMKVFLDRKEVLSNLSIPREIENSMMVIGHFGSYKLLPREIMSQTGFVGCVNYIGINDMGYLNISRWILSSNKTIREFGLSSEMGKDSIVINECPLPSQMTCQVSPCHGGSCEPTSIGGPSQSSANYICNCLYSSRTLNNNFTGLAAEDNFNTWISNYLWRSRSKPCSEDTSQIVITEKSLFTIDFNTSFPFTTLMDLEFLIYAESSNSCIASLSGSSSDKLEIIIVDGFVTVKMSNILYLLVPDLAINNGKWHGVRLQMRYGLVRLKVDHLEKTTDLLPFPVLKFSSILLGQCSRFTQTSFKMKNFMYNGLNVLQYFYRAPPGKLFYQARFIFPYSQMDTFNAMSRSPSRSVTFLSNFRHSVQKNLISLSWLNAIGFQMTIQNNSGSFVHLINGDKILSVVICDKESIALIYKDGSRKSQRLRLPIQENRVHGKIIIDLLKGVIQYHDLVSEKQHTLTTIEDSWTIGKHIQIQFGLKEEFKRFILAESHSFLESNCSNETITKPFVGCVRVFTISVGRELYNINDNWTQHMESYPPSSVLIGQCKDVKVCLPTSCVHGVCRSPNNHDIFCDCSSTNYMGDKCHLRKPQCKADSCQNNGKCELVPAGEGLVKTVCQCDGTGFSGTFCERILCRNDYCLNNGKCYVNNNSLSCHCSSPMFYGNRCEHSLCNGTTCNNRGSCLLDKTLTTVICDCDEGFLGKNCEISISSGCRSECVHGGICSLYNPPVKLCSGRYCESISEPRCNCDITLFRGQSCELPEFGFDPSKDGSVIMDQLVMKANNYLRILIEPLNIDRNMVFFHIQYSANHYFYLYVQNASQLWLRYQSELDQVPIDGKIGDMEKVNILLAVENRTEIHYYLNSRFGILPLFRMTSGSVKRSKRSIPRSVENYPRIILGSDPFFENSFSGLIGGIQWNGRDIMNDGNRVRKGNAILPISQLHTRTFPRQDPHMGVPKKPQVSVSLLTVVAILQCLLFIFAVIQKHRPRRSEDSKIHVFHELEPYMAVKSNESGSDKMDKPESIKSENIVSTFAMMSSSPPDEYIHGSNQIVLIDDLMSLQHSILSDVLIIPGSAQIALVLNHEPMIQVCEKLFPLDTTDTEYSCVSIRVTDDYQYAYCHMKHNQADKDDLVELLVWNIEDSWDLICRPPNITFTSSVPLTNSPSQLLLMNRHSTKISIWRLDVSVPIWSTNLGQYSPFATNLVAMAGNVGHLFITYDHQCLILELNENFSTFQIVYEDFPFSGRCQQLISIQNNNFLLRTESQELYHFDTDDHCFQRKLEKYKITLVAKLDLGDQTHIAMAMSCGQIYITDNIERDDHSILGPKNPNQVVCISFSPDASTVCAGYENNLIHVWRVTPDISLCHFHAVHENSILSNLYLAEDATYIIAMFLVDLFENHKENFIQIIKRK